MKTDAYERHIEKTKSDLENQGIRTDVFQSHLVHQFVLCMWTARRRKQLADVAKSYDAIVVLGCEAAVDTIRAAVDSSACLVIQGVKTEGLMSIQPRFSLTGTVRLGLQGISPTTFPEQRAKPSGPGRPFLPEDGDLARATRPAYGHSETRFLRRDRTDTRR